MRGVAGIFIALMLLPTAAATQSREPPCTSRSFEGSRFTVCAFDSRHQELRLAWTGSNGTALRSFERLSAELGPAARRVRFAMNAGMFQETGMPLGLYVENGVARRPLNMRDAGGNFYLKPNGVFELTADGTVRVEETMRFAVRSSTVQFATQSGPMLVIDGKLHPQIAADGPSQNIRNGVGVRDEHTALFVISDDAVSFGRLARFFRDELKCNNALHFDGSISSAWIPSQRRIDRAALLGPMVVILDR